MLYSWDQWVPQDRLRKWGEENLELAKNLKKEVEAVRNQAKASKTAGAKRRGDASVRDSEERSVTQGKKRARDYGIETVSGSPTHLFPHLSPHSSLCGTLSRFGIRLEAAVCSFSVAMHHNILASDFSRAPMYAAPP